MSANNPGYGKPEIFIFIMGIGIPVQLSCRKWEVGVEGEREERRAVVCRPVKRKDWLCFK